MTVAEALEITIDQEFRDLIAPLQGDEKDKLEKSILEEGCRDSLVLWNGILLDGHNRYEICTKHGISFDTKQVQLEDRLSAKIWIRWNQLARRNLKDDIRVMQTAMLIQDMEDKSKKERARKGGEERTKSAGRNESGKFEASESSLQENVSSKLDDTPPPGGKKKNPKRDRTGQRTKVSKQVGVSEWKVRQSQTLLDKAPDLAAKVVKGEMSLKDANRQVKKTEKAEARKKAADEAAKTTPPSDFGVKHSDFRNLEIEDNSVDLIFTDPPYDRKTLPLYGDMAQLAERVLKPGGSLICYLGQFQIHEVCSLVTPHLRLWWTLCCLHTGNSARMNEYGVIVKWKPMLWFVKGTRRDKETWVEDLVVSQKQKDTHEWQQGLSEAIYYIDKLTLPNDVVFDPFCGGGTTAVAAKHTQRRWITCDVNGDNVKLARKRIADYKPTEATDAQGA